MPVFKSPTMAALHLGPVHLAPSSTLQSLSVEVLDSDAQRHQRTMSSAGQVRAALEAFTGRKGDQYPFRVILKYTDVKDWKRRDRSHVLRKLVALERELPEYAPAFAVVRWMKGYGPSEVLPMEWPPSLDAGGDRGGAEGGGGGGGGGGGRGSGRLASGTTTTTSTSHRTEPAPAARERRRVLKVAVPSGRLSWYYALSEVEGH